MPPDPRLLTVMRLPALSDPCLPVGVAGPVRGSQEKRGREKKGKGEEKGRGKGEG